MNSYDLKYLSFEQEPAHLWPEDIKMFEEMKGRYVSNEERLFFEKMKLKMEYECAPSGDDIMLGDNNEDNIYITRLDPYEFVISRYVDKNDSETACDGTSDYNNRKIIKYHTKNLSDALNHNLKDLIGRDISLLEWLRERNYKGVEYNGNCAYN